jgi:PBSX family phage terminase large subunit
MKYDGMRAAIVRKTRSSMTESVLVTFESKVMREGDPIADGASRPQRHSYIYPNKSEVVVAGMDNPAKIMSTEYDLIAVFEATELEENDWETLTTRLRNGVMPYQQILGDCNPAHPSHWLNQRCIVGKTMRLLSRHEDNPSVTASYLQTLRNLTGARRDRLYGGKWVAQEGMVYEEFNPKIHLIDSMPAGWEAWPKYRSVDFGFTNPFVCQWWALDPDGRLYMYREIYRTRRLVEDHARHIIELSEGERIIATLADHDAEDRATLAKHGVPTDPARKTISRGIQAVQARLRPAGDGKPRIFFLRNALAEVDDALVEAKLPYATDQEFENYVWPKGKDGKPEKEMPVDAYNHGMDAARYMVANFDVRGARPQRRDVPVSRSYSNL